MKRLLDKVNPGRLKDAASSVLGSVQTVPRKSSEAARAAAGRVRTGSRQALNSAGRHADQFLATAQGLLASALSADLNGMLASMVAGHATIYDKAMDAVYLATRIGGGNHRLFDGGHTILGAFRAVRDALPDDTIVEEAMGLLQGLFRDMTTAKGLPLANWDKATYDKVSEYLASELAIPKKWFYDLNSYDAAQLLGGVIGVVATALCWNRADTESFARLVGGMGSVRPSTHESAAVTRYRRRARASISQGPSRGRVRRARRWTAQGWRQRRRHARGGIAGRSARRSGGSGSTGRDGRRHSRAPSDSERQCCPDRRVRGRASDHRRDRGAGDGRALLGHPRGHIPPADDMIRAQDRRRNPEN